MPARRSHRSLAVKLGVRIRTLRREAGVTQEKLAWESGIAKAYLSQVEAGKRLPSLLVLDAIAKRLTIEIADLVALKKSEPRLRLLEAARLADQRGIRSALRKLRLN